MIKALGYIKTKKYNHRASGKEKRKIPKALRRWISATVVKSFQGVAKPTSSKVHMEDEIQTTFL